MDSSQSAREAVESSTLSVDASAEKSASGSLTLSPGCNLALNPDASLSPEVSADNFVKIPDRLRRHFLNIMHYAIMTKNWCVDHSFIYLRADVSAFPFLSPFVFQARQIVDKYDRCRKSFSAAIVR